MRSTVRSWTGCDPDPHRTPESNLTSDPLTYRRLPLLSMNHDIVIGPLNFAMKGNMANMPVGREPFSEFCPKKRKDKVSPKPPASNPTLNLDPTARATVR